MPRLLKPHTGELPIQTDGAHKVGTDDLIIHEIIDLNPAAIHVAQDQVGFAKAAEVTEAHGLPVQTDRAQERGVRNVIISDVVNFKPTVRRVTQQHVGRVIPEEAT